MLTMMKSCVKPSSSSLSTKLGLGTIPSSLAQLVNLLSLENNFIPIFQQKKAKKIVHLMTLHQGKDKNLNDCFDIFYSEEIQVINYYDSMVVNVLHQALSQGPL